MSNTLPKTSNFTQKVRRDVTGGKRGTGGDGIAIDMSVDEDAIIFGAPDDNLTSFAGLVPFGAFLRSVGVIKRLEQFESLKAPNRVYGMPDMIRMLLLALAAGQTRPFGIEVLAGDQGFRKLMNDGIPGLDTVYRDLSRFNDEAATRLGEIVVKFGLDAVAAAVGTQKRVHLDIDTTVLSVFGDPQGAAVGYNPKYHGRKSYQPIIARVAGVNAVVGGFFRPGDRSLGKDDIDAILQTVRAVRERLGMAVEIVVRVDSGGDFAALLDALANEGVKYLIKARWNAKIIDALDMAKWKTVERDALRKATRAITEVVVKPTAWENLGHQPRLVAMVGEDRRGRTTPLPFLDVEGALQVFVTNLTDDPESVTWDYDGRAGIEPLIGELKSDLGLQEMAGSSYAANQAMFLLKLLTLNLLHLFASREFPRIAKWRVKWIRNALILVAGRFATSGRQTFIHVPSCSMLAKRQLN